MLCGTFALGDRKQRRKQNVERGDCCASSANLVQMSILLDIGITRSGVARA